MTTDPSLLIVGHGTRAVDGAAEFHALADRVRALAPGLPVGAGFIELSRPPISEAVAGLVAAGAGDMVAVPLMLLAAGHAKNDIPATLARERLSHPSVRFRYGRELGIRPELLELMDARVAEAVPAAEADATAVLLVGRGSSDPDANSDLFKIARLYYEGRPHPFVEAAFVSLAPPSVPEALERCRRLGARKVVVVPYFLFTGVLERRIREQAAQYAERTGLEVRVSRYFGPDDRVAELVLERYREAIGGDIRMNCDVCVHRVALPGFEDKVGAPATPHHHPDENGHHAHPHAHAH
jgi:sirohydrochlorin cobaltochelatase